MILILFIILVFAWVLFDRKENYGGNQSTCEEQCASSQYYDACMHVCMEGSSADFTGRANEYKTSVLEAPYPLDTNSRGFISTYAGPYRYEIPGK